eukprot:378783_1
MIPGSLINKNLVTLYKTKYALLEECRWSRKVPDPALQSVDEMAHNLTNKMPKLRGINNFINNDNWIIGKKLKDFQLRVYRNPIKYGFAWDVADNTRILITLPLLTTFLYYGGLGDFVSSLDHWNP